MAVLAKGRPGWDRSRFQRTAKRSRSFISSFVLILSLQTALIFLTVSTFRYAAIIVDYCCTDLDNCKTTENAGITKKCGK
jgi:hypothetical protein